MGTIKSLLLLVCLSLTLSPGFLLGDTLTWYHADFPPGTILSGPDTGSGFLDQTEQFIAERLPEYQHEFTVANYARMVQEIRKGRGCTVGLFKTMEREKFLAFSMLRASVLSNGIVFKKSRLAEFAPYIDADGLVDFEQLVVDRKLTLGVSRGRNYTGFMQEVIDRYINKEHMFIRAGNDVFEGIYKMLIADRVDYIVGFPVETRYAARRYGKGTEVLFYAVQKMPKCLESYVACPNNPQGHKVIEGVNAILKDYRHTQEFLGFYENWLDDVSSERYRRCSAVHFGK